MSAVIRLDGVRRTHGRGRATVRAVDGVSLELDAGRITALVGPSGSGKTTVLNLLIGWDRPDSGTVWRHDTVDDTWAGVAVVPQGLGLVPDLTLRENIELPVRLGNRRRYATAQLTDHLGLDHLLARHPDEVSLGEQQRAAVARAVICHPTVVIADEPTAHQDEANADRIMAVLAAAAHDGAAVVVATHELRLLDRADRVLRLVDGRLDPSVEHDAHDR